MWPYRRSSSWRRRDTRTGQMDRTQKELSASSVTQRGRTHSRLKRQLLVKPRLCVCCLCPTRGLSLRNPACCCGVTPTSPAVWRTQGRRRSAPACPWCVWKVCSGSSLLVSSATRTGWPSFSPPWVRNPPLSKSKRRTSKRHAGSHCFLFLSPPPHRNV